MTEDLAMSPGAVADAGFQVPDTVPGHVGRLDQDIQRATVAERFASRAFADALREKLAFEEHEIDMAVEVLLEVAPLLVSKQVVAVDDATVRAPPRFVLFGIGRSSAKTSAPRRLPISPRAEASDLPPSPFVPTRR